MKVYTRRGDAGETDLFGGGRVPKDALRVEAYGAVDELNASVGVAAAATDSGDLAPALQEIQSLLFALGGALATPDPAHRAKSGVPEPTDADVAALETQIDALEEELEPLQRFVLPGGTAAAAALHVARTICRRAERRCVELARHEDVSATGLAFLNRLSDLLFVMARVANKRAGQPDVEWEGIGR
ncbi:MAG: cob(I)yrinic acid a,c-diamide adenosyltransferase [Myxococcota bacterium]